MPGRNKEVQQERIPTWKKWILGARPNTLTAAAATVIVGAGLAGWDGEFQLPVVLAALGGAIWLQIGANLANDVFDYQRGADSTGRLGPKRVTQEGWLSPRQVLFGTAAAFFLAILCGIYLYLEAGWPILAIGTTSIFFAVIYSGGPYPLGYHGLGDVFVFIYFGIIGVTGTYFAQTGRLSLPSVIAAIPIGLLVVNILVVNNYRDLKADKKAGKITLAVRLGRRGTRIHFLVNWVLAYLLMISLLLFDLRFAGCMLSMAALPLALRLTRELKIKRGRALNQTLARVGRFAFGYAVLFVLGGTISFGFF